MSRIAQLLGRASGPQRLRTELRRMTGPVRALHSASESLGSVQQPVPRAVLGGDLLALFSAQLQALIEDRAGEQLAGSDAPAARAGFEPRAAVERGMAAWQLPGGAAERAGWAEALMDGDRDRHAHWFTTPQGQNAAPGWASNGLPVGILRSHVETSRDHPAARPHTDSTAQPSAPAAGARGGNVAIGTALARRLDEYWQLDATERPHGAAESSTGVPADERQMPAPASPAQEPRGTPAWPELPGRELAERMQAFTSGMAFPAPRSAQPPAASSDAEQATIQNVFHITVGSGSAALHELSDKIADLLREQAIHHGIDMT